MPEFLRYYGLDWIGMALCLLGVYMLGNKNRFGFLVFTLGNAVWVFLGFAWMSSLGIAVGNLAFMVINLRGFVFWRREADPA